MEQHEEIQLHSNLQETNQKPCVIFSVLSTDVGLADNITYFNISFFPVHNIQHYNFLVFLSFSSSNKSLCKDIFGLPSALVIMYFDS